LTSYPSKPILLTLGAPHQHPTAGIAAGKPPILLAATCLIFPILQDIEETFRCLLLRRLHRAERLSEPFMNKLMQWTPSRFSVYAEQLGLDHEPQRLEKLARYLTFWRALHNSM
jgi:hypothetical protein